MSIDLELDLTSCLRCAWTGYTINTCPICEEEMIKNKDMPAMPCPSEIYAEWVDSQDTRKGTVECFGLTKLEDFTKAAMTGLLASGDHSHLSWADLSQVALGMAEAQLNALEAWESQS